MDEEGETSSRPGLIRFSYDFSTVIPESRGMTYGGYSGSYYDWEMLYDWFYNVEAADFTIVETGSGILLMVS